jgi:hypothetical protein
MSGRVTLIVSVESLLASASARERATRAALALLSARAADSPSRKVLHARRLYVSAFPDAQLSLMNGHFGPPRFAGIGIWQVLATVSHLMAFSQKSCTW